MKRAAVLLLLALACHSAEQEAGSVPPPAPSGSAERGKVLAAQYGCNVCHIVPGVEGPRGSLGPSLEGVASRPALSNGTVKNTPENLAQYIQNPSSLNPQATMPALGLPAGDANDLAAYLMTLK